jgi:hypothetical protein
MEGRLLIGVVVIVATFYCSPGKSEECHLHEGDLCKCSTNTTTIDLGIIFSGLPQYVDGEKYIYSPCKLMVPTNSTKGATQEELAALVWKVFNTNTALGREATTWTVSSDAGADLKFRITYSGGDVYEDTKKHWKAVFDYSYSPNDTRIAHMGADENKQHFVVTGKTVRPVTAGRGSTGVAVGVVGLVFIILCLVAVVTYCVVGVAYNYQVKGERGSDIIPNAALWVELPVLVKDGVCFTISPCTSKYRRTRYRKL